MPFCTFGPEILTYFSINISPDVFWQWHNIWNCNMFIFCCNSIVSTYVIKDNNCIVLEGIGDVSSGSDEEL